MAKWEMWGDGEDTGMSGDVGTQTEVSASAWDDVNFSFKEAPASLLDSRGTGNAKKN
ncbi:hypothetical protein [Nostoc sp. PA-18-2419]|uniref:hypothetical protein n=1 Tax=Nostoc sp. PA-18-2419 TaxID=2575443 RepID=UPI00167A282F|nr:hypothetical protein [Nostoc sp. PA-18-2419]